MKAILFKTDGTETPVSPANGKDFSLQEMYDLIGCSTVEHVTLVEETSYDKEDNAIDGVDLWCDEEGLLKPDWIPNARATEFYRKAYPNLDPRELVIVGNALVVDKTADGSFLA